MPPCTLYSQSKRKGPGEAKQKEGEGQQRKIEKKLTRKGGFNLTGKKK